MKRILLAAAASAALLSPVLASAQPAPAAVQVPPIQFTTRPLANGLKVFTSRDVTTPNVTVQVWYGVGAKDDPQGRSGFAHLFEHMMFKATRNMPSELLDRLTEADWQREGTHTEIGRYGVDTWLGIYGVHAHDHAAQITRARA